MTWPGLQKCSRSSARDEPGDDQTDSKYDAQAGKEISTVARIAVPRHAVDGYRLELEIWHRVRRNQPTASIVLPVKLPARKRPNSHSQILSGWR